MHSAEIAPVGAREGLVLSIEQGSTYTQATIFTRDRRVLATARDELPHLRPAPGWAVQDAEEIWTSVIGTCRMALVRAGLEAVSIAAIAIAAQRATAIIWDRETGLPLGHAICAEDRRTSARCKALREAGVGQIIRERTGLPLTADCTATKLAWMLDNVPGARDLAAAERLAFGTVDSFLLWRMTSGRVHATDASQAARTLLFDVRRQRWDDDLLRIFEIPRSVLPWVHDSASYFGAVDGGLFGGKGPIPIRGMVAMESAAMIGQACFQPGSSTVTYDEGCMALLNIGDRPSAAAQGLMTTLAYRLDIGTSFAFEGMNHSTVAGLRWLVEGLGIEGGLADIEGFARDSDPDANIYWVPPTIDASPVYGASSARGGLIGIEARSGVREFARAALESIAYQTRDLFEAMAPNWGTAPSGYPVRVNGGIARSDWAMQFLADILERPVERSDSPGLAAQGAAWLAGSSASLWPMAQTFAEEWVPDFRFEPAMTNQRREEKYAGWREAVRSSLG